MIDSFILEFSKLNFDSISKLLNSKNVEFEFHNNKDAKIKLKKLFHTFLVNNNAELIAHEIKCNLCSSKLFAFVGNKSPHYIILKIEEKQEKLIISNCVSEYPSFNLNGLKLIRAYELMIGIKQPEPNLSSNLFGENENIKQIKEWCF